MKLRWKLVLIVGVAAAIAASAFLFTPSKSALQKAVTETRDQLKAEGYKVDLSEFNFTTSGEMRTREAALNQTFVHSQNRSSAPQESDLSRSQDRGESSLRSMELMNLVGNNAAIVLSKTDRLGAESGEDLWPVLREFMEQNRARFDAAAQAVVSGPLAYNLNASHGTGMLLPHLAQLKGGTQTFGRRAILDLHDGRHEAAYTNVLAATRLTTAWHPESIEISHLVRFACANLAYQITWQFLHDGGSTEPELLTLQREWEGLDIFKALPETAAWTRACVTASCQAERKEGLTFDLSLREAVQSPRYIWPGINDYFKRRRYLKAGSYEDEKGLLLYYRDREVELKNLVQKSTWSEMQTLPGAVAAPPFVSKYQAQSRTQAIMNLQSLARSIPGQGGGWLKRAAETEAKRRILITALALERYYLQHHAYPETLEKLVPDYLKALPIDFMDGKPLRYRPTAEGQFTLYSVGPDCIDDGGKGPTRNPTDVSRRERPSTPETDIVWLLPATAAQAAMAQSSQADARRAQNDEWTSRVAQAEWTRKANRQSEIEKILSTPAKPAQEPTLNGRPITELIRAKNNHSTTNRTTVDELFTLKQVITGDEPEVVTFELPIDYHAVTNLGEIYLLIDLTENDKSDSGFQVGACECHPAPNGNCLLTWNTVYESPGKHALQAGFLELESDARRERIEVTGPLLPFFSSNICQFSESSGHFEPALGATMYGKLPEDNGVYSVDIQSTNGAHIRTLSGRTDNSIIKVYWDLKDGRGRTVKELFFNSIFTITLPDSGRTQVQRGP